MRLTSVRLRARRGGLAAAALTLAACGGTQGPTDAADVPRDVAPDVTDLDAPPDDTGLPPRDVPQDHAPAVSAIEHVVVIVQENHTFDNYFGRYCTAPAGSNPTCTEGPACCEAAPDREPSGAAPVALTDGANADYDPDHSQGCERDEIHGGAMDRFVTGASCSDRRNWAIAPDDVAAVYHRYARQGALADRYFQPIVGQTSANDMYFAVARRVFTDNDYGPDTLGRGCILPRSRVLYTGQTTVADLLLDAGFRFGFYAEGYRAMIEATACPAPPSDCHFGLPTTPCDYDPSDVPFQYYRQFADNPLYMHDLAQFATDLAADRLPDVAFVKFAGYHNEHPGYGTRITEGAAVLDALVQRVLASPYARNTLVLVTWDEGGGFFDHVSPPGVSPVDGEAPGTRVPLIALGRFARRNAVSHVPMEHPSVVRFLEYNFLGATGQLHARDAVANNLGSLLDPAETGILIPEH